MRKRTETRPIRWKLADRRSKSSDHSVDDQYQDKNVAATVEQIRQLTDAGCQIVRMAVYDQEDARAIREIKAQVSVPLGCRYPFRL